jgi:hypothetical protein
MTTNEEHNYARAAERAEREQLYRRCQNCGQEEWAHSNVGEHCPADAWFDYTSTFRAVMTEQERRELEEFDALMSNDEEEWSMSHCLAHGELLRDDGTGRMYCPVCEQELADERRNDR